MFSGVRGNHEKQGSLACMAENGCLRVKHGKILSENGARRHEFMKRGFRSFAQNIKLSRAQTALVEFVEHFVFLMR